MTNNTAITQKDLDLSSSIFDKISHQMKNIIVGQDQAISLLINAIFSGGHVLVEGPPGTGKTLLTKAISASLSLTFKRVQFTPDLIPGDLIGMSIYRSKKEEFEFIKGPIFTNILLADEINRATPKTQSALLEAMEEQQVSVDGKTMLLPDPYIVIATQNPLEYQGVFPLPEAQLDRFSVKIDANYLGKDMEVKMLHITHVDLNDLKPVMTRDDIIWLRNKVSDVYVSDAILEYTVDLIHNIRSNPNTSYGPSPRTTKGLLRLAKVKALRRNRSFVIPDDVVELFRSAISHRFFLSSQAKYEGINKDQIMSMALHQVALP